MPWARILLLFEAFGTVFQGQISRCFRSASRRAHLAIVEVFLAMSEGLEAIFFLSFSFFLVGSVGDVSRVLLACVLHALDTKGQVKWMLVLVTVMSCPCYLNNFPLELTRCCEANFCFEKLTKPQGEGSAAWAVALQSGRRAPSQVRVLAGGLRW